MKRGTRAPRIWPIEPLLDITGITRFTHLARAVRANGVTASSALNEGLTDRQADNWAIRCGYHPAEIWPEWFEKGLNP
ncbi:hypothetical protein UFOVP209_6 [uncultured Caudovirales phage]|uniref:Uncharacterized protein n=1 Tax=uncultured Caudovirales phage TaxID=2100421 RepID=A0A6J7WIT1_9CAUD|nr:hypothetical protein UFOVP209_6 [uncultured Caudovirales phage]